MKHRKEEPIELNLDMLSPKTVVIPKTKKKQNLKVETTKKIITNEIASPMSLKTPLSLATSHVASIVSVDRNKIIE